MTTRTEYVQHAAQRLGIPSARMHLVDESLARVAKVVVAHFSKVRRGDKNLSIEGVTRLQSQFHGLDASVFLSPEERERKRQREAAEAAPPTSPEKPVRPRVRRGGSIQLSTTALQVSTFETEEDGKPRFGVLLPRGTSAKFVSQKEGGLEISIK